MWQKIKDFIKEWELLTSVVLFALVLYSYPLINRVFYTVPDAQKTLPGLDAFYYSAFTILIYVIFLSLKWRWFKWDSPRSAEIMRQGWKGELTEARTPADHNKELIFANLKWFGYLLILAMIALAVYP